MPKSICVYASSSDALALPYQQAAAALGALIAHHGDTLVYGGGKIGLMGIVARSVHQDGGRVIGVIPEKLVPQGYSEADEFIITPDMRQRKAIMEARADAFVVLPGGFGTLEEALEIITLKQLGYHTKPVVLLNTASFYDPLVAMFEHLYERQFAYPAYRVLYHVAPDAAHAYAYLNAYAPPELPAKWMLGRA